MNQQGISAYFPSDSIDHHRGQANGGGPDGTASEQHGASNVVSSYHNGGTNSIEFIGNDGNSSQSTSQYITSNANPLPASFHTVPNGPGSSAGGNATVFVTNNHTTSTPLHSSQTPQQRVAIQFANNHISSGQQPQQQHIIITGSSLNEPLDEKQGGFMECFIETPQPTTSFHQPAGLHGGQSTRYAIGRGIRAANPVEKTQRELAKKVRQAEAARQRYHRLSLDEKKALNVKRTVAQKRKRQREKEMAELEQILRQSNDIVDDPEVIEQLREKRMRAKWAEAARQRYQRMSEADRRMHNSKRKLRQAGGSKQGEGKSEDDPNRDVRHKDQNRRKAEAARQRYHRMSQDEKRMYNQRRTDAFRRRRMEEEALLAMPIGRINGEALERAQQIVVRNAKRAEAARLRYALQQRMTPEQRKVYNQKRYTPKRRVMDLITGEMGILTDPDTPTGTHMRMADIVPKAEMDVLSSLERDVVKRTHQAQQILVRQRQTTSGTALIPIVTGGSQQQGLNVSSSHLPQQRIPASAPPSAIQIIHPGGYPHQQQQLTGQSTSQLLGHSRHLNQQQSHPIQVQYITAADGGGGMGDTGQIIIGNSQQPRTQQRGAHQIGYGGQQS